MPNRFVQEYGIDHPIVQGTLGMVSMPALVAAVSEAGGMGTLGAIGWPLVSASELRELIRAVRALTPRPFAVALDAGFVTEEHISVCIDARVVVVTFDTADPPQQFVRRLRGSGIRVWAKAGSVEESLRAARQGVDAVIAHGREAAGGARSVMGTFTLVPAVVDAVWPVPVLASGGIADGRGLAAALALGADAAWIGTRFLASREANAHIEYKRRVVEAGEGDTGLSTVYAPTGRPARVRRLRKPSDRVARSGTNDNGRAGAGNGEGGNGARRTIGTTELGGRSVEIKELSCIPPTPEAAGEISEMCMPAGQSVVLVRDIRPAGELVRTIAAEAEGVLGHAFPNT